MCVFTVLLGAYEQLNEQFVAPESEIPFICFTDDPALRSGTWQMRLVSPLFGMDPIRSQRDLKLRPHIHLPDYDFSIYIDNSVLLTKPPEWILERYRPASGFCLPRHSFQESVLDEFLEVVKRGLDDQGRVFEQLNHYTLTHPQVLEEKPYWTGILLRNHTAHTVRAVMDIWSANVHRYSRRDQLSVNAALSQVGLIPDVMDIDNYKSSFHAWPHTIGRKLDKGLVTPNEAATISFSPPFARVRMLEQQLAEITQASNDILDSPAWRIGDKLSESARRHPWLLGLPLRVARRILVRR